MSGGYLSGGYLSGGICPRIKEKTEEKTGCRESDRRREVADLLVLTRPAKSVLIAAGFSGKLQHTGHAEKERVASVPQRE